MTLRFLLQITTLISFIPFIGVVYAQTDIAKCIDENGDPTYTRFPCNTTQATIDSRQIEAQSLNRRVQNNNRELINAKTISPMQLQAVTDNAIKRCLESFGSYFKRKFPASAAVSSLEFHEITDQFIQDNTISISIVGSLQYADLSDIKTTNIECTVQKFSEDGEWMTGYLNN